MPTNLRIIDTLLHGEPQGGDSIVEITPKAAPAPQRQSVPERIFSELFGRGPSGGVAHLEYTDKEAGG